MAAPLDLTGRRFGRLLVIRPNGRVKWGKWQSAWLCRCDCGAEITVPLNRLPHRDTIPQGHRVTACPDCRAKPCLVCGAPVPLASPSTTCSAACRLALKRARDRMYYHRHAADPEFRAERNDQRKAKRRALSPDERLATSRRQHRRKVETLGREALRESARKQHAGRMKNPAYREKKRAVAAKWVEENRDKVRQYSRNYRRRQRAARVNREVGLVAETLKDKPNDDE